MPEKPDNGVVTEEREGLRERLLSDEAIEAACEATWLEVTVRKRAFPKSMWIEFRLRAAHAVIKAALDSLDPPPTQPSGGGEG